MRSFYIICENTDQNKKWFKVGISKNPDRRLKDIKTNNPLDLYLHSIYTYNNPIISLRIEQSVIESLKNLILDDHCKKNREWYYCEWELLRRSLVYALNEHIFSFPDYERRYDKYHPLNKNKEPMTDAQQLNALNEALVRVDELY